MGVLKRQALVLTFKCQLGSRISLKEGISGRDCLDHVDLWLCLYGIALTMLIDTGRPSLISGGTISGIPS